MDWQEVASCWVFGPRRPKAIVQFLGGAFVGTAPQVTYRWLLEQLGQAGYLVVAVPFLNEFEHARIARDTLVRFERAIARLDFDGLGSSNLPVYGLGHSMGCKIHLLAGSLFAVERAGNILLAYNNDSARNAVPAVDLINDSTLFEVEFSPSPAQTLEIVAQGYRVRHTLVVRFRQDSIDCSNELMPVLEARWGDSATRCWLPGNHLTPTGQELQWQSGQTFDLLDVTVRWAKEEFLRDIKRLRAEILQWLDPKTARSERRSASQGLDT